jgi:hypothetical protein
MRRHAGSPHTIQGTIAKAARPTSVLLLAAPSLPWANHWVARQFAGLSLSIERGDPQAHSANKYQSQAAGHLDREAALAPAPGACRSAPPSWVTHRFVRGGISVTPYFSLGTRAPALLSSINPCQIMHFELRRCFQPSPRPYICRIYSVDIPTR